MGETRSKDRRIGFQRRASNRTHYMITTANDGHQQHGEPIILLVIPPFQSLRLPALNVSQLKANLLENGYPTEVLYLNYLFAERITPHSHELISSTGAQLYGEYIFSFAMRERGDEDIVRYMEEIVKGPTSRSPCAPGSPARNR